MEEQDLKVLMINGSPNPKGNTAIALNEMEKVFAAEGFETEILHIGKNTSCGFGRYRVS